ncbi:inorganic phosphate transmembrane transporter [Aureococcus anophagefferens]|nr:inorganic phosphate transmembrane transporter [Aureococcus anophagefferens]
MAKRDGVAATQEPTPSKRRRDTPPTKQVASRPARIVKLLVGGREHATTRSTLSLVTGSFLDRLVNQEDEGGMAAMDDGRFFIDRDGDIFGLVLDYLRSAGESVPQFDPETLRRLRIDADARRRFYGLEDLARQCDENLAALEAERGREKEPVVVRVLQQSNAAAAEEETDAPPMPLKRRRSEAVEALGEDVFGADDF